MNPTATEPFTYHTLPGLFPEGYTLVYHQKLLILSLQDEQKTILDQTILTDLEYQLLKTLIENYPYHAPYEQLYAAYEHLEHDRAVSELRYAVEHESWGIAIRNMRNSLSRLRLKLQYMKIDIVAILDTGYQLMPAGKGLRG